MKTLWTRRAFLQGLSLLGAGWTVKGWASPMTTSPFSSSLAQISETRNLMGTFVTITLFDPSRDRAQSVLGTAFQRMETMIRIFNRHDPGSALSYLNERGALSSPPPELHRLLRQCLAIHAQTGGLFDVTIKPVLDLYESEKELGRLPAESSVRDALSRVGAAALKVRPEEITFSKEGMGVTLDGIAKGTIVDDTSAYLRKEGIRHGLVDAGGDLRVFGGRGDDKPWRIAVYEPNGGTRSPEMILLREGAVATSGNYMVYFDQEKIHHHILSPVSGSSPPRAVSGTVTASSAETADALATALLLLGPEEGLSLINRKERLAAMLLTREGGKLVSRRWPGNKLTRGGKTAHV